MNGPRVGAGRGFSMIEVLITLVVLAFGLLALINLQVKMHMNEVESYQRAQAVVLLQDMANRIQVNPNAAGQYSTGDDWLGIASEVDCSAIVDLTARADCTAWDGLLKGTAVVSAAGDDIGAMIGARGCVVEVQPRSNVDGACSPGIYRISVAWQGLVQSTEPDEACAAGEYGDDDGYRRVVSTLVSVGVPRCL